MVAKKHLSFKRSTTLKNVEASSVKLDNGTLTLQNCFVKNIEAPHTIMSNCKVGIVNSVSIHATSSGIMEANVRHTATFIESFVNVMNFKKSNSVANVVKSRLGEVKSNRHRNVSIRILGSGSSVRSKSPNIKDYFSATCPSSLGGGSFVSAPSASASSMPAGSIPPPALKTSAAMALAGMTSFAAKSAADCEAIVAQLREAKEENIRQHGRAEKALEDNKRAREVAASTSSALADSQRKFEELLHELSSLRAASATESLSLSQERIDAMAQEIESLRAAAARSSEVAGEKAVVASDAAPIADTDAYNLERLGDVEQEERDLRTFSNDTSYAVDDLQRIFESLKSNLEGIEHVTVGE
jgi:hypothetical protein